MDGETESIDRSVTFGKLFSLFATFKWTIHLNMMHLKIFGALGHVGITLKLGMKKRSKFISIRLFVELHG
tara:strand:+ start:427 stop:636 length:210 start_codon:yes stop_codon:yes gene_type:complete